MLSRQILVKYCRTCLNTFQSCRMTSDFRTEEEEAKAHKESMRKFNKASLDYEYLFGLRKTQLVYKVIRLQRQVDSYSVMKSVTNIDGRDKIRVEHPDPEDVIDHRDFNLRRVAFKVAYLGWDYMAYAWSDNSDRSVKGHTNIVERVFLEALLRQQLVQGIGRRVDISRSGRTDRGVSGLSQVICANVRSNLDEGYGVWKRRSPDEIEALKQATAQNSEIITPGGEAERIEEIQYDVKDRSLDEGEIPYVTLLNQALPPDIRVLAWSPVRKGFSVRRGCKGRTYRYFFPRGRLDLDLMAKAAQKLVGTHDFRNFGKLSTDNFEKETVRTLNEFKIEVINANSDSNFSEFDICAATISSRGFLYRQVRLMMAVLCAVGNGNEDISIIDELLDDQDPLGRPSYNTLSSTPLLFYNTIFEDDAIDWRWDSESLRTVANTMSDVWCEYGMKCEVLKSIYMYTAEKLDSEHRADVASAVLENLSPFGALTKDIKIKDLARSSNKDEFHAKERKRAVRRLQRKGRYSDAADVKAGTTDVFVGWKP